MRLSSRRLREEAVFGARQAEIFAQRPAFVFAAEEAAALQLRDDPVDEIVEPAGDPREHDVEPVAGIAEKELLHLIDDRLRRPDHREPAITAGDLRQLTDRQIIAPRSRN